MAVKVIVEVNGIKLEYTPKKGKTKIFRSINNRINRNIIEIGKLTITYSNSDRTKIKNLRAEVIQDRENLNSIARSKKWSLLLN